jgi:MFS family permease
MIQKIGKFFGSKDGKEILTIFINLNIFVYALCYWIQTPVLPYISKELGADAVQFGTLISFVSFFSFIGAAAIGRVNDTKGAKVSLLISQIGSFVMYLSTGFSNSLFFLFLSRLPSLVQHSMLCSQSAISELSSVENRSLSMGRLSLR